MNRAILTNNDAYARWRDTKLEHYQPLAQCIVEVDTLSKLSSAQCSRINSIVSTNNFVIIADREYVPVPLCIPHPNEQQILALNAQLGLKHNEQHYVLEQNEGQLAIITPSDTKTNEFIPYTTQPLNWHTDGYYNSPTERIRSFTLFCSSPAISGGANHFMDIEMLYILMREQDSELTALLTRSDAMTIPAHIQDGVEVRPASIGPIFFHDRESDTLYMRYTQRKRNITFADGLSESIKLLNTTLSKQSPYHHVHTLTAGESIMTNNIIHTRDAFVQDNTHPRVMLRGRYFQRINI